MPVGTGRRPGRRVRVRQVHAGPGRGRPGSDRRRADPARRGAGPDPWSTSPAADGLPGPVLVARPAHDDRREHRRGDPAGRLPQRAPRRGRPAARAGAPRPRARRRTARRSCPAASGSGSRWPVPSAAARRSSSPTRSRRRSTSRSRAPCSTWCASSSASSACRCCSSPTTSRWSATSRRTSPSCTAAGSSSRAPPPRCSRTPPTTYTRELLAAVPGTKSANQRSTPMTRRMRIDDLTDLAVPSQPALSPDGDAGRLRAAHARRRGGPQRRPALDRAGIRGHAAAADQREGRHARRPGRPTARGSRSSGRARSTCSRPTAASPSSSPTCRSARARRSWSPDGARLAFSAPVDPADDRRTDSSPTPTSTTRPTAPGMLGAVRSQLHVLDLAPATAASSPTATGTPASRPGRRTAPRSRSPAGWRRTAT